MGLELQILPENRSLELKKLQKLFSDFGSKNFKSRVVIVT